MSFQVTVTLTVAGGNTGPFNIYQDYDSYANPVATNVAKSDLLAGYIVTVGDGATIVRVQSENSTCSNYVNLNINGPGTTPTPTPTLTPTPTPATFGIGFNLQAGTEPSICGAPPLIAYSLNGTVTYNEYIYYDSTLNNPVTGYKYVADEAQGEVFHLNPLTGQVEGTTGISC